MDLGVGVGGGWWEEWSGGDALAIDRTMEEQGINRGKKGKQVKGREGGESRHCDEKERKANYCRL